MGFDESDDIDLGAKELTYFSFDPNYDPETVQLPPPFGLNDAEKAEIIKEVLSKCQKCYASKMYKVVTDHAGKDQDDFYSEGYIYMVQIMKVFDKRKVGLVNENGVEIKKPKPASYYFYHYYRTRVQLLQVNTLDKKSRWSSAIEINKGAAMSQMAHDRDIFANLEAMNDFEMKAEIKKFVADLPAGQDEFFADAFMNSMTVSDMRKKYGKMYAVHAKAIKLRLTQLKGVLSGSEG